MTTIRNLIDAAREGSAAGFEKSFSSIVAEKLSAALGQRKTEVLSGMFGLQSEEQQSVEEDNE